MLQDDSADFCFLNDGDEVLNACVQIARIILRADHVADRAVADDCIRIFTEDEFEAILNSPNKSFTDYSSYYPIFSKYFSLAKSLFKFILPWKPSIFFEQEVVKKKNK